MLTLRRETDYAIHMLKYLSIHKGGYVSLRELADATNISFLFLQKIARKLRLAKLIRAGAGVSGGYCLNLPAKQISLKKIIESIEGSTAILPCLCDKKTVKCKSGDKKCSLKIKLGKMNKLIDQMLNKTKLNDL